jgi:hypothetical protein
MESKSIAAIFVLALAVLAAGCGTVQPARPATVAPAGNPTPVASGVKRAGNPAAFAWLRPAPAPATWSLARLHGSAALAYPPSWRRIRSDPGTVSAARVDEATGLITEYLNATPRQGDEALATWVRFRPEHNREEGDSREHVLAAAEDLRFRDGSGSCVIDRYRTSRATYQEIACLVRGPAGESVIVAAAQASRWAQSAAALERAVSAFLA